MLRIILVIGVLIAVLLLLRGFLRAKPEEVSRWIKRIAFTGLLGLLIFLAVTGRAHWLFAAITGAIPIVMRLWKAWRVMQFFKRNKQQQQGNSQRPTKDEMDRQQAYHILGLQPGASRDEIIKAHRKLMLKVHPDRGGSDELASQLNAAKECLLKNNT